MGPITVVLNVAGIWTDTDVVGSNSCNLLMPVSGSSRTTPGIKITQSGGQVTLTAPPNILGTQTVASGEIKSDGTMVLTGSDSGTSITLNLKATSGSMITGNSTVTAGGCTYNFSNSLVKTDAG